MVRPRCPSYVDIGLLEGGCEAGGVAWQQQHAERTVRRTVGQAQPISYLNAAVSSRVLGNQCHRAGDERAQAGWARVQKTRQNPNKARVDRRHARGCSALNAEDRARCTSRSPTGRATICSSCCRPVVGWCVLGDACAESDAGGC